MNVELKVEIVYRRGRRSCQGNLQIFSVPVVYGKGRGGLPKAGAAQQGTELREANLQVITGPVTKGMLGKRRCPGSDAADDAVPAAFRTKESIATRIPTPHGY